MQDMMAADEDFRKLSFTERYTHANAVHKIRVEAFYREQTAAAQHAAAVAAAAANSAAANQSVTPARLPCWRAALL